MDKKRTTIFCRWRRVQDGMQLISPMWWVAFYGPSEIHDNKIWYAVAGTPTRGHVDSPEEAVSIITTALEQDPTFNYHVVDANTYREKTCNKLHL